MNSETVPPISPVLAGVTGRCPRCGKGPLFSGFLSVAQSCKACGLDYGFADSGDGPAVFIMLFVGFIVVAVGISVEIIYEPPYWLHALLWVPLTLILSLGLLRPFKGVFLALQYRHEAREGRLSGD